MIYERVVIVEALRTPITSFGGPLKDLLPSELMEIVLKEIISRVPINLDAYDEVILGHCLQRSDDPNTARVAALRAGLPQTVTGMTVQRQCSSGMEAIVSGFQQIMTGDSKVVLAGGVECMSSTPYTLKKARWGQRLQHGEMTDALWDVLRDPLLKIMMGETAENLATKYHITREEQDHLALRSHQLAVKARDDGRFDDELTFITITGKKGEKKEIKEDQHPRENLSIEDLRKLPPVFKKGGSVTAGNSSGINDGAATVLLMAESTSKKLGLEPLGYIVSHAKAGVEPELMGYGPVPATEKALQRAGLKMDDIQLIELNEAFAAQYLACEKLLQLDRTKVNVNGGGIALGHPIGCTGTRLVVTLLHEMKRRDLNRGLATLCVGGGMGMALVLER